MEAAGETPRLEATGVLSGLGPGDPCSHRRWRPGSGHGSHWLVDHSRPRHCAGSGVDRRAAIDRGARVPRSTGQRRWRLLARCRRGSGLGTGAQPRPAGGVAPIQLPLCRRGHALGGDRPTVAKSLPRGWDGIQEGDSLRLVVDLLDSQDGHIVWSSVQVLDHSTLFAARDALVRGSPVLCNPGCTPPKAARLDTTPRRPWTFMR
jgi:hypothetical protein